MRCTTTRKGRRSPNQADQSAPDPRRIAGSLQVIDGGMSVVAMQGEVVELSGQAVGIADDASESSQQSVPVDCHTQNFWIVPA